MTRGGRRGSPLLARCVDSLAATPRGRPGPSRSVLEDPRYRFCHEDDYPLTPDEHASAGSPEASEACPSLARACALPPVDPGDAPLPGRLRAARAGGRDRGSPARRRAIAARGPRAPARARGGASRRRGGARRARHERLATVLFVALRSRRSSRPSSAPSSRNFLRDAPDEGAPDGPPERDPAPRDGRGAGRPRPGRDGRGAPARPRPGGRRARRLRARHRRRLRRAPAPARRRRAHRDPPLADQRRLRPRARRRGPSSAAAVRRRSCATWRACSSAAPPPSEPMFRSVIDRVLPLVGRALVARARLRRALRRALVHAARAAARRGRPRRHLALGHAGDGRAAWARVSMEARRRPRRSPSSSGRWHARGAPRRATSTTRRGSTSSPGCATRAGTCRRRRRGRRPHELGLRIAERRTDRDAHRRPTEGPSRRRPSPGSTIADAERRGSSCVRRRGARPCAGTFLVRGDSAYAATHRSARGGCSSSPTTRLFTNVALAVARRRLVPPSALSRAAIRRPSRDVEICDELDGRRRAATPLESVAPRRSSRRSSCSSSCSSRCSSSGRGAPFARLRDPPAEARRAFADHARALGRRLRAGARLAARARPLRGLGPRAAARAGPPRRAGRGSIPLAEAIAARTGRPEGEVMGVLVEANGARDEAAPPSSFRAPGPARAPAAAGGTPPRPTSP